jgi:DNA-directed RNA polymerase specialized sigma24 family protein
MRTREQDVIERARRTGRHAEPVDAKSLSGLRKRISLLREDDQVLVELAMSGTASHRRIAELVKRPAGTVSRRLQKLAARLHDPIVLGLLDEDCPLSPQQRQIGVEHLLTGLSVRDLAAKHQIPLTAVMRHLHSLRDWHRTSRATRAARTNGAGSRDHREGGHSVRGGERAAERASLDE